MMNVKTREIRMFLLTLVTMVFLALPAMAAQETYVIKEGAIFRVKADGEAIELEEELGYCSTDNAMYSWLLVDPELSESMKGSESGIYFFNELDESLGFLPFEGAAYCNVSLSPGADMITINFGTDVSQELLLYTMDGFEKKMTFQAVGDLSWLDPCRFVFTMDDAKKGSRGDALDQQKGWLSVMMYDAAMEELFAISEATETEDYLLIGVNPEGEEVEVLKRWVKDVKDWGNDEKIKDATMSVPIPAAG